MEKGGGGSWARGKGPGRGPRRIGPRQLGPKAERTSYWKVSCRRAGGLPKGNHHKKRSTKNFLKYYNRG